MEGGFAYVIAYKTRGGSTPYNKPRLFFSCYYSDFESTFQLISDDILKLEDCVIYYHEGLLEDLSEELKQDINEMNLIVIPITHYFLCKSNPIKDILLPYVLNEHIPILPIIMSSNLIIDYSKSELFSNLQYLERYNADCTQISYEEKLKTYLKSVLINDETTKRIRAAFDAYIFLSYRKKDRRYANSLIQMIHNYPMCRDIAIWYDEYLIPGENFNKEIEQNLTKSDLFALLVTPNLVNESNYVQGVEYPAACEMNKTILPIEMVSTNRELLEELFQGIPKCVNSQDEVLLRETLNGLFEKHALRRKKDEPEHNFLIGLAYLEGIDVEIDRKRALDLITDAASSKLPEAMKKLIDMYSNGIGVSIDLEKAKQWAEELGELYLETFGEKCPESISSLNNLSMIYLRIGEIEKASNILYNIYENTIDVYGYKDIQTIKVLANLAFLDNLTGNIDHAIELYIVLYNVCKKEYGEFHPISLVILNNLASCYVSKQKYEKEKEIYENIYLIRCRLHGKNHQYTLNTLNNLAVVYGMLGDMEASQRLIEEAYTCSIDTLGNEHPDTLLSLRNVAEVYRKRNKLDEAKAAYLECYEAQRRTLGESHHETLATLNALAVSTYLSGELDKATQLFEELLNIYTRVLGTNNLRTLRVIKNLAILYFRTNDYGNVEKIYSLAYESFRQIWEEGNDLKDDEILKECLDLACDMYEVANYLFERGRYKNAFLLYEISFKVRKNVLGIENDDSMHSLSKMAYSAEEMGDHKKAIELYLKLYKIRCKVLGELHEDSIATLSNLAYSYESDGDYEKALEINKSVYEAECKKNGEYHSDTLTALNVLADAYRKNKCFEEATIVLERGYEVCYKNAGQDHPATLKFQYLLAKSLIESRNLARAYALFKDLHERFLRIMGETHRNTVLAKEWVDRLRQVLD